MISYHHTMVRDFGGMEECVAFSFTFQCNRTYTLQWFREGLTCDNEQQYGQWRIIGDMVHCKTLQPLVEPDAKQLRYAEPGRTFDIPIHAIFSGTTSTGWDLAGWEFVARG